MHNQIDQIAQQFGTGHVIGVAELQPLGMCGLVEVDFHLFGILAVWPGHATGECWLVLWVWHSGHLYCWGSLGFVAQDMPRDIRAKVFAAHASQGFNCRAVLSRNPCFRPLVDDGMTTQGEVAGHLGDTPSDPYRPVNWGFNLIFHDAHCR